ncbi:hypothetical protein LP420_20290 [Massilia sp. B-10]|nr:hypothetical protein LP420_20290 [Massilia sp. B-10]
MRPLNNEIWLEERVIRQRRIVAVLREIQQKKLNRDATMAVLHKLLEEIFNRFDAPERKPFFDSYIDGTINLVHTCNPDCDPGPESARAKADAGLGRRLQSPRRRPQIISFTPGSDHFF